VMAVMVRMDNRQECGYGAKNIRTNRIESCGSPGRLSVIEDWRWGYIWVREGTARPQQRQND
jgi:hypothetical protein